MNHWALKSIVKSSATRGQKVRGIDNSLDTMNSLKQSRILYYGAGRPTNIGNAFIDLGAMAILKGAIPGLEIAFASEMPRWFFTHAQTERSFAEKRNILSRHKSRSQVVKPSSDNALDIGAITKCDMVAFAGMAMCDEFVQINGPTIVALAKRGVPVLLLGTGALAYTETEQRLYGEFLEQVKPVAFISRDSRSFELFRKFVPNSFDGIDCAFFLPGAYTPFELTLPPYIVAAFDHTKEPEIEPGGRLLIRAHHECWGPSPLKYVQHGNTHVSDIPQDYLTLYANAEAVHTDRVHACIAALAYGRRARLYRPTPRGALFDSVGANRIGEELVQIDVPALAEKRRLLIEFVAKCTKAHL